jgi:hypothetical protein
VGSLRSFVCIFPVLLVVPVLSVASCGGLVLQLPSDAGIDASTDGPEAGIFAPPPPVASGPCGAASSGSCGREGLICEFGADPSSPCDTLRICTHGTLQPFPVADSKCPTINSGVGAACPGYEAADAGSCTAGTTCDYPQGRCQCAALIAGSTPSWHCVDPGAGCTPTRPRLGQPCSAPGQRCVYDACGVSPTFGNEACDAGAWVSAPPNVCPG